MSVVSGALSQGRRMAELRMTETGSAGSWTDGTDPTTLEPTRVLSTAKYTGIGQIKFPTLTVSEADVAGQQIAAADIVLKLPMSAPLLAKDDEWVTATSSVDSALVGRRFRVKAPPQSGQVTSHRYPVEEVS